MIPRLATAAVFSASVLVAFSTLDFALSETKTEEPDKVFVGYVYQQPQKINFHLYTHLCHAFVVADEDGKIRPSRACPNRQLVTDAHKQAGVKVLDFPRRVGLGQCQFTAIVSKPEAERSVCKGRDGNRGPVRLRRHRSRLGVPQHERKGRRLRAAVSALPPGTR